MSSFFMAVLGRDIPYDTFALEAHRDSFPQDSECYALFSTILACMIRKKSLSNEREYLFRSGNDTPGYEKGLLRIAKELSMINQELRILERKNPREIKDYLKKTGQFRKPANASIRI